MGLFRKKGRKDAAVNERQEQIAGVIAKRIIQMQSAWAAWMQRQSQRLSRNGQKTALIICCILTTSYCMLVIVRGIAGKRPMNLRGPAIQKPMNVKDAHLFRLDTLAPGSFHRFWKYLDSLAKDSSGRRSYDSIMKTRPGLIDTAKYVERIFQSQIKNQQ